MIQALPAAESLPDTLSRIRFSVFMRTYSVPAAEAAAAAAATYIGEEDLLLRVLGSELFVHLACSHFFLRSEVYHLCIVASYQILSFMMQLALVQPRKSVLLLENVGMRNGSRGRRWQVFRL